MNLCYHLFLAFLPLPLFILQQCLNDLFFQKFIVVIYCKLFFFYYYYYFNVHLISLAVKIATDCFLFCRDEKNHHKPTSPTVCFQIIMYFYYCGRDIVRKVNLVNVM